MVNLSALLQPSAFADAPVRADRLRNRERASWLRFKSDDRAYVPLAAVPCGAARAMR